MTVQSPIARHTVFAIARFSQAQLAAGHAGQDLGSCAKSTVQAGRREAVRPGDLEEPDHVTGGNRRTDGEDCGD